VDLREQGFANIKASELWTIKLAKSLKKSIYMTQLMKTTFGRKDIMAVSRHHRKSKHAGGTNDKENISRVSDKKHRAFHLLFSHGNPYKIASVLNKIRLDPDFKITVRRIK